MSTPCTRRRGAQVSWFSLKTKVNGLSVVWPQNHCDGFSRICLKAGGYGFSRFGLKTSGYGFCGLVSKPLALVFWFGPQNWHMRFSDLAHKITMAVSSFGPQNHVGYGLSVAPQNRRDDEDSVGHTLGSSGLLHLEESQTRVSQFCLKTEGGVTAGDECGINAEVAWK
jgi:hypothetical protein